MTLTLRTFALNEQVGDPVMPTSSTSSNKRETLNIRIKPEERSLIDRAAEARGKNRTDFVLEAARMAAEEALLDQAIIAASPEAYTAFLARLDMPPEPNERLLKTMRTSAPWEKAWRLRRLSL
jgi:uncharacterized protein (DUF1778 family)